MPFVVRLGGGILTCFDLVTSIGDSALSTAGIVSAASCISPEDESFRRMVSAANAQLS